MFPGYFADNGIRDFRALAEPGEVQLLHFSAAAHVVHQIIRISFAANESHGITSDRAFLCSVFCFHYTRQVRCSLPSKSVLKELTCNLPSFLWNLSSLFPFRSIDFSYTRISSLYREFFTDLDSAHLFNTAVNISTLA